MVSKRTKNFLPGAEMHDVLCCQSLSPSSLLIGESSGVFAQRFTTLQTCEFQPLFTWVIAFPPLFRFRRRALNSEIAVCPAIPVPMSVFYSYSTDE
jgi:hypothetical protein